MNLRTAAAAACLMVAGCAHYQPQPIDTAAVVRRQQTATLDAAALAETVRAMAPAAAAPVPGEWDRLTLFAAAGLYNPDVIAARAGVTTAAAQAEAARQALPMTLTLATEYARDASTSSPWLLGGGLDIPLDVGGLRAARVNGAALAVDDARFAYAETLWSARMAIAAALVDRFAGIEQARIYREAADLRARQLIAAERQLSRGETSRTDLERVRAEGADAARLASDAQRSASAADAAIAAAIGLPSASLAQVRWPEFADPAAPACAEPDGDAARQALLGRPDILHAMIAYGQAEQSLRGEVARQYPQITLSPGYNWDHGLSKLPFNLGLALPPLDLNRHAIAAAEAARAEKGRLVEASVASASAELVQARAECHAARAALDLVRTVELPTAQRLAASADRELAHGLVNRVDWASAKAGALTAQASAVDALVRLRKADAALENALRRPLSGPELMIAPHREQKP